jgi:hypothetical protein
MSNTQEGNRIIAHWMNVTVYPEKGTSEYKKWKGERCDYDSYELKYHTSWDWIMPAWAKAYKALRRLNDSTCHILINQMGDALVNTDIAKAHEVLIRAIKHIN